MFLNPFFHLNPMSALTHTSAVKILSNVRWQHEAELGRVPCWGKKKKKAKAENPIGLFFFFFSFFQFVDFCQS